MFGCPQCGKAFANPLGLRSHQSAGCVPPSTPAQTPASCLIAVTAAPCLSPPATACLAQILQSMHQGEQALWRVVHGPMVAVRNGPSTEATIIGVRRPGDVLLASATPLDGWVQLAPLDAWPVTALRATTVLTTFSCCAGHQFDQQLYVGRWP